VRAAIVLLVLSLLSAAVAVKNHFDQRRMLRRWNQAGVRMITWQPFFRNTYLRAISPKLEDAISNAISDTTLWERPIMISCVGSKYKLTDDDLLALSRMTSHLSLLDVRDCNVTGKGLQHLQRIEYLRQLDLCGVSLVDADLESIGKLKTLESLNLSRTQITDASLIYLCDLKNLMELDLTETAVTSAGISRIQRRFSLQGLKVKLGHSGNVPSSTTNADDESL